MATKSEGTALESKKLSTSELEEELAHLLKKTKEETVHAGIELSWLETDLKSFGIDATLEEIVNAAGSLIRQGRAELFLEVGRDFDGSDCIVARIYFA